jgi:hypothetical protein
MESGGIAPVDVRVYNSGRLAWSATGEHPIRLSYHWLRGACPSADIAIYDGARTALPYDVPPGGTVDVTMLLVAPDTAGVYCLKLDAVQEQVSWFHVYAASQDSATVRVDPSTQTRSGD